MPLTPIAGIERLRYTQIGKESTFKTQVPATRVLPFTTMPTMNPNWTTPTAQTGTLDPAIAPYRAQFDITATSSGELYANDAPYLLSAALLGGVTPTTSGTAKTWTYSPASTSQDVFDTFTMEWGDDAAGDQMAYMGGVIDQLQFQYPQSGGPITFNATWRFASMATYPSAKTGSLNVDLAPTPMFATDTTLYIDDAAGSIGISPVTDTMYDATVTINNNLDIKRFANGSNTRFQVANYGRGPRTIETTFSFAKSSKALVEVADWLSTSAVERFISLDTVSTATASTGPSVYYGFRLSLGGFWFTRSDPSVNSNTAIQLVCHSVYDTTLGYPIKARVVNTLGAL